MRGKAALACWWDIDPAVIEEFEDWHNHEHIPERLDAPGFLQATRWDAIIGSPRYFVYYPTRDVETLTSATYLNRLNHPTPWSQRMFRHFRNMTRSVCTVCARFGTALGETVATVRLSPEPGRADELRDWLIGSHLPRLAGQPGLVSAQLLENHSAASGGLTREQAIRGKDAVADWIVLVGGDAREAVMELRLAALAARLLTAHGAIATPMTGVYTLACSRENDATASDS